MASTHATADDSIATDVYHDGEEVAVRVRSQHSRDVHVPETDDDGDVVFYDDDGNVVPEAHDDAHPRPACKVEHSGGTEWVLRELSRVENRGRCRRCYDREEVKEQNSKNGASKSFARKMRYGDDWGEDTGTDKANTSGD